MKYTPLLIIAFIITLGVLLSFVGIPQDKIRTAQADNYSIIDDEQGEPQRVLVHATGGVVVVSAALPFSGR